MGAPQNYDFRVNSEYFVFGDEIYNATTREGYKFMARVDKTCEDVSCLVEEPWCNHNTIEVTQDSPRVFEIPNNRNFIMGYHIFKNVESLEVGDLLWYLPPYGEEPKLLVIANAHRFDVFQTIKLTLRPVSLDELLYPFSPAVQSLSINIKIGSNGEFYPEFYTAPFLVAQVDDYIEHQKEIDEALTRYAGV